MAGRMKKWLAILVLAGVAALAISTRASAGLDDRSAAEATLKEVEASARRDVATEMVARAKVALDRSARLRAAGDDAHARLADALARTWAEAAREVVRAAETEEKAATARRNATDAGVTADRERALLEEGIAQSGRLRAQLESLDRESKEQPARTSAQGADAGVKTKPQPAPKDVKDGGAK
jgi:hypothetical protein